MLCPQRQHDDPTQSHLPHRLPHPYLAGPRPTSRSLFPPCLMTIYTTTARPRLPTPTLGHPDMPAHADPSQATHLILASPRRAAPAATQLSPD